MKVNPLPYLFLWAVGFYAATETFFVGTGMFLIVGSPFAYLCSYHGAKQVGE